MRAMCGWVGSKGYVCVSEGHVCVGKAVCM